MQTMNPLWDWVYAMVEVHLGRLGVKTRDERGAVTTEMAVVTVVMVSLAAVGGYIFVAKLRSNALAIPDRVTP